MADIKISQMTDGGAAQAADQIPAVRTGANVRVNVAGFAPKNPTVSERTDDYQIALPDNNTIIEMNKATEVFLDIPDDSDVDFPIGAQILAVQRGVGKITLTHTGAVQVFSPETLSTAKQNATIGFYKSAVGEWVAFGNLEVL